MRDASSAARLVILATAAVFINYIDRGNLATAASLIQDQLHLSATQIGILLSAFYYGYVVCMPAMGWLAERYGAKRVMAMGVFVWSIATFATGFAGSFAALLVLRVVLGIGESVAFPCASKVLAQAVEVGRLGIANGVLSFGYLLGPAVGTLLGGYLMLLYGWRACANRGIVIVVRPDIAAARALGSLARPLRLELRLLLRRVMAAVLSGEISRLFDWVDGRNRFVGLPVERGERAGHGVGGRSLDPRRRKPDIGL